MTMMSNHKQKGVISAKGGLHLTEQLLGLRNIIDFDVDPDVVFVSIDLEFIWRKKGQKLDRVLVKEFGIATLDTRRLRQPSTAPANLITTQQFSTSHASRDFIDCDVTDFKECVFVETFFVSPSDLPATVTSCLQIKDDLSPDPHAFRKIVLVGHSTKSDIRNLENIGVDVYKIAPVIAIVDTWHISQKEFGGGGQHKLSDLLEKLRVPHQSSDFHNAGNDATYTIHTLLAFAIRKRLEDKHNMHSQLDNLELLKRLLQKEIYERPRWKPIRQALGSRASSLPPREGAPAPAEYDDSLEEGF